MKHLACSVSFLFKINNYWRLLQGKEPEKGADESTGEGFLFFKGVIFNSNNNNQADNQKEPMAPARKRLAFNFVNFCFFLIFLNLLPTNQ